MRDDRMKRMTNLELVLLDQFVEIDRQQLECDTLVVAECEVVQHVHDVVPLIFSVLSLQVLQDADLLLRLAMEALLVAHQLQRDVLLILVVVRLDHLQNCWLVFNPSC